MTLHRKTEFLCRRQGGFGLSTRFQNVGKETETNVVFCELNPVNIWSPTFSLPAALIEIVSAFTFRWAVSNQGEKLALVPSLFHQTVDDVYIFCR